MLIGSVWRHYSGLDYCMNYYIESGPRGESDVLVRGERIT